MNYLFVHEVNWRDKVIFEIHDIPELLSIAGNEVTFIDFPEDSTIDSQSIGSRWRTTQSPGCSRAHEGSSVDVLTPGFVVKGRFRRYFATLTFVPLFLRTVKDKKIDLVILYGVPTNGWQTVLVAKILGLPVIFRSIDVSHQLRKYRFKALIRTAERFVYRNADHISVHNLALKDYCVSLGAGVSRISIDYPRLDTERFVPTQRNESLATSYGIRPEQKIVFFRGTLYRFCGLQKFLSLFADFLLSHSEVFVLIVGSGEAENSVKKTIADLGLGLQVRLTQFVDYDSLVSHICLADVSINTFEPSLVTHCALPGRVLQSMSCAIPVVSTPLRGMMNYSADSDAVDFKNLDESFINGVVDLLSDSNKQKIKGLAGRDLVISKGSWDQFIEDFQIIAKGLSLSK